MDRDKRKLLAAVPALALSGCGEWGVPPPPPPPNIVNDITQLNPIAVEAVVDPYQTEQIAELVANHTGPISIGGGRFSQGGQTACDGALFIDVARNFNLILSLDEAGRTITVQPGATWRQIQAFLDRRNLSPKIMQSFCNFTVGGSLSVNCHGDYVGLGPIIESVRSFRIVLADGSIKTASREENRDLFRAAIGGYGGVGVIAEVTLEVAENEKLERLTHRMRFEDYPAWLADNIAGNDDVVLHHAVLYPGAYTNIAAEVASRTDKELTIPDRLAPMGEPTSAERSLLDIVAFSPAGRIIHENLYDPLTEGQPAVVWRNYEAARDAMSLEPASRQRSTYALQEYFVPTDRFAAFVPNMARILRDHRAKVLNVAIRHTRAHPETLPAGPRARSIPSSSITSRQRARPRAKRSASGHANWSMPRSPRAEASTCPTKSTRRARNSLPPIRAPKRSSPSRPRSTPATSSATGYGKRITAPDVAAICAPVGSLSRHTGSLCSAPHIRAFDSNPSATARPEDDDTA